MAAKIRAKKKRLLRRCSRKRIAEKRKKRRAMKSWGGKTVRKYTDVNESIATILIMGIIGRPGRSSSLSE